MKRYLVTCNCIEGKWSQQNARTAHNSETDASSIKDGFRHNQMVSKSRQIGFLYNYFKYFEDLNVKSVIFDIFMK